MMKATAPSLVISFCSVRKAGIFFSRSIKVPLRNLLMHSTDCSKESPQRPAESVFERLSTRVPSERNSMISKKRLPMGCLKISMFLSDATGTPFFSRKRSTRSRSRLVLVRMATLACGSSLVILWSSSPKYASAAAVLSASTTSIFFDSSSLPA